MSNKLHNDLVDAACKICPGNIAGPVNLVSAIEARTRDMIAEALAKPDPIAVEETVNVPPPTMPERMAYGVYRGDDDCVATFQYADDAYKWAHKYDWPVKGIPIVGVPPAVPVPVADPGLRERIEAIRRGCVNKSDNARTTDVVLAYRDCAEAIHDTLSPKGMKK